MLSDTLMTPHDHFSRMNLWANFFSSHLQKTDQAFLSDFWQYFIPTWPKWLKKETLKQTVLFGHDLSGHAMSAAHAKQLHSATMHTAEFCIKLLTKVGKPSWPVSIHGRSQPVFYYLSKVLFFIIKRIMTLNCICSF